jgi:uncharacterized protein YjbI with pentapeptide repeats
MANEQHLSLLKRGVKVWNEWWEEKPPGMRPDLSGAKLNEANLSEANLYRADLGKVDLREANLSEANLSGADLGEADLREANLCKIFLKRTNLSEANLRGADLRGASLSEAHLDRADLSEAYLGGANLSGANLGGANFREAIVGWTTFGATDLSVVKGLDTVVHHGASHIDIHTLYNSNGKIPEVFLRGCGLSDWEIEAAKLYQPDLTSAQLTDITYKIHELHIIAVHYYSCFIRYSSKDQAFAERLHNDLQAKGVRCWYAPEDMKIGDKIRPRIDESIRIHDKLLLILSEHSINSVWVEKEVETAFEEEQKRKQTVLFPVRLDKIVMETGQAWAADIRRTRHIGDFGQWKKPEVYQKAFDRLLKDLKAER